MDSPNASRPPSPRMDPLPTATMDDVSFFLNEDADSSADERDQASTLLPHFIPLERPLLDEMQIWLPTVSLISGSALSAGWPTGLSCF
jgi:hypothetical protein